MTSNSSSVSSAADDHGVLVRRLRGNSGRGGANPNFNYFTRLRYDEDGWSSDNEIVWSTTLERGPRVCSCNGLVYIDVHGKQMVICNPKTKEFKTLPPSPQTPPCPTTTVYKATPLYEAIGFGFDSESNDFKVVRCVTYVKEILEEDGPLGVFAGLLEDKVELYSLKSDSWKVLPFPKEFINTSWSRGGAYVSGKYYWVAHLDSPDLILHSFHFASESFGAPITLPPLPTISNRPQDRFHYRVVEYVGSLGVVCYELDGGRGESKSFSLLVWKEQEWHREFGIRLSSVRIPLGFSKDGRYLFLQGEEEHGPQPVFLFVYDLFSEELKKLDIYEAPGVMEIVSY